MDLYSFFYGFYFIVPKTLGIKIPYILGADKFTQIGGSKNDEINGVWNNPGTSYKHWHSDWINYEVDHVVPVNSDGEDNLQNVQFLSPNANRFIKCSMTNEQLLRRIDLSDRLKERIREVQEKRASLFASIFWRDLIDLIAETEK